MSDMCAHGYTIDCADCWRERCVELEAEMEAELAELSADYHGERLRADSLFDQLAALREAVDTELVCCHIGTLDSMKSPKHAVAAIARWHYDLGVSGVLEGK